MRYSNRSEVIQAEVLFRKNEISIWDLKKIQCLIDALEMMDVAARLDSGIVASTDINFIKTGILNGNNAAKTFGIENLYGKGVIEIGDTVCYRLNLVRGDGEIFNDSIKSDILLYFEEFSSEFGALACNLGLNSMNE